MERVIKFRIWNELGKNMLYDVESVYECLIQQIRFDNSQPSRMQKVKWDHRSDGIVWMQFTGLHDKYRKEIYEGDILGGYPHGNAFVKWNDEYACFESISYSDVANEVGDDSTEEVSSLLANDLKDCNDFWQVIGNIYENPNLLK